MRQVKLAGQKLAEKVNDPAMPKMEVLIDPNKVPCGPKNC